jgi:hypothetical protein
MENDKITDHSLNNKYVGIIYGLLGFRHRRLFCTLCLVHDALDNIENLTLNLELLR